jgi:hypothetical protein
LVLLASYVHLSTLEQLAQQQVLLVLLWDLQALLLAL